MKCTFNMYIQQCTFNNVHSYIIHVHTMCYIKILHVIPICAHHVALTSVVEIFCNFFSLQAENVHGLHQLALFASLQDSVWLLHPLGLQNIGPAYTLFIYYIH